MMFSGFSSHRYVQHVICIVCFTDFSKCRKAVLLMKYINVNATLCKLLFLTSSYVKVCRVQERDSSMIKIIRKNHMIFQTMYETIIIFSTYSTLT